MAKGDRDLMPSTGSMIPSHTEETKVREEASRLDPLGRLKRSFLPPRPSLSLPHFFVTFQSFSEVGKTCLTQGPHDGQTLCWSALMRPQQFQELRRPVGKAGCNRAKHQEHPQGQAGREGPGHGARSAGVAQGSDSERALWHQALAFTHPCHLLVR